MSACSVTLLSPADGALDVAALPVPGLASVGATTEPSSETGVCGD